MQMWRLLAGVLVGCGGLLGVLVAMAQARDSAASIRSNRPTATATRVAAVAGVGLLLTTITVLLVLTVLPASVTWALTAAVWLILLALFLVG